MGKKKAPRTHSTSILTALFAVVPAAFLLTNTPAGATTGPLGYLLTSNNWQGIVQAFSVLAQNVIQNWLTVLILLAVVFISIKVVRKAGRGARITKHLRM